VFVVLLATGAVKREVAPQRVVPRVEPDTVFVVLHDVPLFRTAHSGSVGAANRSLAEKRFSGLGSLRLLRPCFLIRHRQYVALSTQIAQEQCVLARADSHQGFVAEEKA